jgi:hypothetical protein
MQFIRVKYQVVKRFAREPNTTEERYAIRRVYTVFGIPVLIDWLQTSFGADLFAPYSETRLALFVTKGSALTTMLEAVSFDRARRALAKGHGVVSEKIL